MIACLYFGGRIFLQRYAGGEKKQAEQISPQEKKEEREVKENIGFPENSPVQRKNIYDRNLNELALSFLLASVYVKPLEIKKEEGAVSQLSELLGLNEEEVSLAVSSERGFVWLARNIDRAMVEKIQKLSIAGVYLVKEGVRFYPQGKHASHIVGFHEGGQGLAGVESYYDNVVSGNVKAGAANMVAAGIAPEEIGQDGASLILTVDLKIQEYLDERLDALISRYNARSGMAMILQSTTGEILALAHHPTYDSNLFWKFDSFERRNRMLTDPFPLGAFVQIVRMAAEMEHGNIPDYISESEEIAPKIIEPKFVKKVVSEKLIKSINLNWKELDKGVYWPVVEKAFSYKMGKDDLAEFAADYGLSGRGYVDLPMNGLAETESSKQPKIDLTDQHASATGLQALIAFNRLVSGGRKVVPHVLKDIWFEKSGKRLPASFEEGVVDETQQVNRKFIRLVHELSAVPQKNEVLFETLIEQIDDPNEQGLELESSEASPVVYAEATKSGENRRFQNIVLGAIPSLNPELVMIMVVDGMLVDLGESSEMQLAAGQILRKGLKIYLTKSGDSSPDLRLQEKELFEKWSKLQTAQKIIQTVNKKQAKEMPDVLNLSFRKALQVLQNYNVRIRAEGSGRVVGQHPAPGTQLSEVGDCVLELKVDN